MPASRVMPRSSRAIFLGQREEKVVTHGERESGRISFRARKKGEKGGEFITSQYWEK